MKRSEPSCQGSGLSNNQPPQDLDGLQRPSRLPQSDGAVAHGSGGGRDEDELYTRELTPEEEKATFAEWDKIADSPPPSLTDDPEFQRIVHVFGRLRPKKARRRKSRPLNHISCGPVQ